MATGEMSWEKSRHCKEPGMCHDVRNCTNEKCALTATCQFIPKVQLTGAPVETLSIPKGAAKLLPDGTVFPTYEIIPPVARVETQAVTQSILPTDKQARKDTPICTGVFDYFTAALAEVARVSKAGNDQHNPGQPLHWARGKSMDHSDCILRHLVERGTVDTDGMRHSAKMAWRALALLQQELEDEGAPMSRASRIAE